MIKIIHRHINLLPFLAMLCVLVIFFTSFNSKEPYNRQMEMHFFEDRPSIFIEQCQFYNDMLKGDEGSIDDKRFSLRGMMLVFRHGERSPIVKVNSNFKPNCMAFSNSDKIEFNTYANLVKTSEFRDFVEIDPLFNDFVWHPHPSNCEDGQTTPNGILRMRELGEFLYFKYAQTDLFKDINTADITVVASTVQRTFQSAIAFSSNFFYNSNLKQMKLKRSNSSYFCLEDHCVCRQYDQLRVLHETKRVDMFKSSTSPDFYNRIQMLGRMMGIPEVNFTIQFQDVLLGRYVCRFDTLPCNPEGDCITVDDYMKIVKSTDVISRHMFEHTSSTRYMTLIEAWTLLDHLSSAIISAENNLKGPSIFKVFSGHDITLEPLMQLFSLGLRIPPDYRSRMIFELYESAEPFEGEHIFVRMLFKGKDLTHMIEFCKPLVSGLCRGSVFKNLTANHVLNIQKPVNVTQLCNA